MANEILGFQNLDEILGPRAETLDEIFAHIGTIGAVIFFTHIARHDHGADQLATMCGDVYGALIEEGFIGQGASIVIFSTTIGGTTFTPVHVRHETFRATVFPAGSLEGTLVRCFAADRSGDPESLAIRVELRRDEAGQIVPYRYLMYELPGPAPVSQEAQRAARSSELSAPVLAPMIRVLSRKPLP